MATFAGVPHNEAQPTQTDASMAQHSRSPALTQTGAAGVVESRRSMIMDSASKVVGCDGASGDDVDREHEDVGGGGQRQRCHDLRLCDLRIPYSKARVRIGKW